MYSLFSVLIGLFVYEGINALPTSQNNDLKIGTINKYSKNLRRMIHGKRHRADRVENPEFKSMDESVDKYLDKSIDKSVDKSLETVVTAIDSGVKAFMASDNKSEIIENFAKTLVGWIKDSGKKSVFRSNAEEFVKPELVHFRNNQDDKPSVLLELNSKTIINGLKDLLQTPLVHKLMQHYSKEAAQVYRSIKYEPEKPQDKE